MISVGDRVRYRERKDAGVVRGISRNMQDEPVYLVEWSPDDYVWALGHELAPLKASKVIALIALLERLHESATPEPWSADPQGSVEANLEGASRQVACITGQAATYGDTTRSVIDIRNANAQLIAEVRNALPEIIGTLRRLA